MRSRTEGKSGEMIERTKSETTIEEIVVTKEKSTGSDLEKEIEIGKEDEADREVPNVARGMTDGKIEETTETIADVSERERNVETTGIVTEIEKNAETATKTMTDATEIEIEIGKETDHVNGIESEIVTGTVTLIDTSPEENGTDAIASTPDSNHHDPSVSYNNIPTLIEDDILQTTHSTQPVPVGRYFFGFRPVSSRSRYEPNTTEERKTFPRCDLALQKSDSTPVEMQLTLCYCSLELATTT